MKIGYARVSTEEQHLDLQLSALNGYGCDRIFCDHGKSGSNFDRPGLQEALSIVCPGDSLIVWRLDRLGRSLSHLVQVVTGLGKRGVEFVSMNESIDTETSTGMLMFHMIAALAEFERSLISERTRAGMAAARQRGTRIGRPRALTAVELERAGDMARASSVPSVAQVFNMHERTLRRHLKRNRVQPLSVPENLFRPTIVSWRSPALFRANHPHRDGRSAQPRELYIVPESLVPARTLKRAMNVRCRKGDGVRPHLDSTSAVDRRR